MLTIKKLMLCTLPLVMASTAFATDKAWRLQVTNSSNETVELTLVTYQSKDPLSDFRYIKRNAFIGGEVYDENGKLKHRYLFPAPNAGSDGFNSKCEKNTDPNRVYPYICKSIITIDARDTLKGMWLSTSTPAIGAMQGYLQILHNGKLVSSLGMDMLGVGDNSMSIASKQYAKGPYALFSGQVGKYYPYMRGDKIISPNQLFKFNILPSGSSTLNCNFGDSPTVTYILNNKSNEAVKIDVAANGCERKLLDVPKNGAIVFESKMDGKIFYSTKVDMWLESFADSAQYTAHAQDGGEFNTLHSISKKSGTNANTKVSSNLMALDEACGVDGSCIYTPRVVEVAISKK